MCSDYDYSAHDFNSGSYSEEKNQLNAEHEAYLKGFRDGSEKARKKGHWNFVGFMVIECSECKIKAHELEYTNFCPNCGAAMRGEADE